MTWNLLVIVPQTVCLTLRVLILREKRWVRLEVADRIRGISCTFVFAFSFRVAILVLSGWPRWSGPGLAWQFL